MCLSHYWWRNEAWNTEGSMTHPDFGRSVSPMSTRGGGQILPTTLLLAHLPRIIKTSYGSSVMMEKPSLVIASKKHIGYLIIKQYTISVIICNMCQIDGQAHIKVKYFQLSRIINVGIYFVTYRKVASRSKSWLVVPMRD